MAAHCFTITIRYSSAGHESENTLYVSNDRSRIDYSRDIASGSAGAAVRKERPCSAIIERCDLGRVFLLDLDACEYEVSRLPTYGGWSYWLRAIQYCVSHPVATWNSHRSRPPTVVIETTTVDTGERKEAFGFTARHVVTTTRRLPIAPAHDEESETKEEGWYIDIDPTVACRRLPPDRRPASVLLEQGQIPQFKTIGPRETGYGIEVTSVLFHKLAGRHTTPETVAATSKRWVTQLSTDLPDPQIFEIPPGFRRRR